MKLRTGLPIVWVMSLSGLWAQSSGTGTTAVSKSTSSAAQSAGLTITGVVKLDDASPLPGSAGIQLICGSSQRTVAHTNVMDDFGFQWTGDTTTGRTGIISGSGFLRGSNSDAGSVSRGTGQINGESCEIRAELGGYRSSSVSLNSLTLFDGLDIGVIWLHQIALPNTGNTVSASSLSAPKGAKKDFEKARQLANAHEMPEAEKCLERAVEAYPVYAEAWLSLGRTEYEMRDTDKARYSLRKALDLDPKIAETWRILGYMAADERQWDDAARYLDRAERLDPANSALAWFYSAVAYYELRRFEQAERSIRMELKLDPHIQYPRSEYLLGLILIERNDVAGATEALRNYLSAHPDPRDRDSARSLLGQFQTYAAK